MLKQQTHTKPETSAANSFTSPNPVIQEKGTIPMKDIKRKFFMMFVVCLTLTFYAISPASAGGGSSKPNPKPNPKKVKLTVNNNTDYKWHVSIKVDNNCTLFSKDSSAGTSQWTDKNNSCVSYGKEGKFQKTRLTRIASSSGYGLALNATNNTKRFYKHYEISINKGSPFIATIKADGTTLGNATPW